MKTKKEILQWWIEREKIDFLSINDYMDFCSKIATHEVSITARNEGQIYSLTLRRKSWKYPITLHFHMLKGGK